MNNTENHLKTNKHDLTFKEVFSQKRIAEDFLKNNIPKEALDIINLESLELQKASSTNKELKEIFFDLIYKVQINNQEGYISFLLEHKSYKDKLTIFQVHKYILEFWTNMVKKEGKKELPIIIPIVIYHGQEKWNLKTDLREMIPGFHDLPEYFKERVPVFKHELINIKEYEENDFEKYTKLTAMMLKAFKYAFEENLEVVLRVFLLAIKEAEKEESLDTLIYYGEIYLKYIELTNSQLKEEDIREEIRKLDGKGDVTMGILEQIEERGIKKAYKKAYKRELKKENK
ncbi:Putative transposase, YhgA-like, partial [Desulfonispora thiosulfatigenes DSM 11270]